MRQGPADAPRLTLTLATILITSHGTTGDVIPSLRLSRALARLGHKITLALSPNHCQLASNWDIASVPIGSEFGPGNVADVINKWNLDPTDMVGGITAFVEGVLKPYLAAAYHDFAPLVPEHDLIISNNMALWAAPACERRGKPYAILHVTVLNIPSQFYLPTGVPCSPPLDNATNARAWKLARLFNQRFVVEPMRQTYEKRGLSVPKQILLEYLSPYFNLLPLDPMWAAPAPDWPKNIVQTGFLEPESDETSVIPDRVRSFVEGDSSRPLLIFTFGSIPPRNAQGFYERLIPVVRAHGLRSLIVEGWGMPTGFCESDVFSTHFVSFNWLFKRASIVVHHGGIGTSADCLRAGVPQIVVPHGFYDQPDNGMRVERLGCGKLMSLKEFTPSMFDKVLRDLLGRLPSMRQQAELIRDRLQLDGKEKCAEAVERFLRDSQSK